MAYALAQRRLTLPEPLLAGPLFGAGLWAFSYVGWLPATGLYPPPTAEPSAGSGLMIPAHLIQTGTATAAVSLLPIGRCREKGSGLATYLVVLRYVPLSILHACMKSNAVRP